MGIQREWRCKKCSKLLGVHNGTRLHIRFARGHEYLVGTPATGTCRSCGTLNEFQQYINPILNGASSEPV